MNGMISRRKYVSMTMMMLVLLFMFQFAQVVKETDNDYSTNSYAGKTYLEGNSAWQMNQGALSYHTQSEKQDYVAFLGDIDNQLGSIVYQWCVYTKRDLKVISSTDDLKVLHNTPPEVLLIDASYVDFDRETNLLLNLARQGVSMVFCNLPDAEVIEENENLRVLLGIRSVEASEVELSAIKLFSGFLLGEEVIYDAVEGQLEGRQDLDLTIPWYVAFGGTKTYMVGVLANEPIENEYLPAIIWRNSIEEAKVFAVNGDYMYDSMGLGILDAMMAELHTYELYPVVNAQNLTIANFPGFAEENTDEMMRLYSRTQSVLARDIMWPAITATAKKNQQPETLFFMAQADYEDAVEPRDLNYVFYLRELKEQKAEAGVSLTCCLENGTSEARIKQDSTFYESVNEGYVFTAAYTGEVQEKKELVQMLTRESTFQGVRTIVQCYAPQTPVVGYLNERVTLQNTTSDGFSYTYMQDLRMRSLQTALGYSNILVDMYPLMWPESPEHVWEKMYDSFSRNINTYWQHYTMFDKTTATECDNRIRCFFALDYEDVFKDNTIYLQVDNLTDRAWFLLRTQEQKIAAIEGASFTQIEEDAFLIEVTQEKVCITLEDTNAPYYYPQK